MKNLNILIPYLFLLSAIFFGIFANGLLKTTEGFTKIFPSIMCGTLMLVGIIFLSKAMNTLPVGFTYATYAGLTIAGVTIFGIIKYNQIPNLYSLLGIGLIIVGIVMVNYLGKVNT